jgi:hypothetical protein
VKFDYENSELITLFPNPSSEILYLQNRNNAIINRIYIYDFLGNEAIKLNVDNQSLSDIKVSHLPAGIYIMRIDTSTETYIKRFSLIK